MRRPDWRSVRFACGGLVPLFGIAFACSQSEAPPPAGDPLATGSVDERRSAAEKEFAAELAAIDSTYSNCKDQLKTQPTCTSATQTRGLFDGLSLCPVLRPFKGLLTDANEAVSARDLPLDCPGHPTNGGSRDGSSDWYEPISASILISS